MNYDQAKTEFDALPIWVKQMVSGMRGCVGYGSGDPNPPFVDGFERGICAYHVFIKGYRRQRSYIYGFLHIKALAKALDRKPKKENVSSA